MTTFLSARASVMARFVVTKVLPAWGFDEVTMMICNLPDLTLMKPRFERISRNASETLSRPLSRTTTDPCRVEPWYSGMSPRNGMLSLSSMSLRQRMVVSRISIR